MQRERERESSVLEEATKAARTMNKKKRFLIFIETVLAWTELRFDNGEMPLLMS